MNHRELVDGKTHFADDDTLRYVATIEQQRDELQALADSRLEQLNADRTQALQLKQQRDELLTALIDVRADLVRRAEINPDGAGVVLNISSGVLRRMDDAITKAKPSIGGER